MIDWRNEIYIGEHANDQTIKGYILALEEVVSRYAHDHTLTRWVCTSRFGMGEGYRESYSVKGWSFSQGDEYCYVNRAFNTPEVKAYIRRSSDFNHIPSGGVFEASKFLSYLKKITK